MRLLLIVPAAAILFATEALAGSATGYPGSKRINDAAETYSRLTDYGFMKLSPNGMRMASTAFIGGINRLVVLDVDPLRIAGVSKLAAHVNDVEWLDDDTLVMVVDDMVGGLILVKHDVMKDESEIIQQHRDVFSGSWTADIFPPYSYADGNIRYALKRYEGAQQFWSWDITEDEAEPLFGFAHPYSNAWHIGDDDWLTEEWTGLEYQVYHSTTRQLKIRDDDRNPLFSGSYLDWNGFRPVALTDANNLFVTASNDGKREIAIYDFDSNSVTRTLVSDPDYDLDPEALIHEYTGKVIGVVYDRDRPSATYFDSGFESLMQRLNKALPGHFNIPVSMSGDGNRIVIRSFNSRDPGQFLVFDKKKNSLTPVLAHAEWLYDMELSPKEVVHFKARDGLKIEAYFTRPLLRSANNPLVIMPHGGPHVRDTWRYEADVQFLASLGYAVLQPNYRISTGYGQDHFTKGLEEVGHRVQLDLLDAVDWANEQGYGANKQACIVGSSFGGYSAMRAATLSPQDFQCVIASAGFYDLVTMMDARRDHPAYEILKVIYGDPDNETHKQRMEDASPLFDVESLNAPVLVMHGRRDVIVDVAHADALIEALEAHGKQFESLIRRDEGHGFRKVSNRRRAFVLMGEFLSRHLPLVPLKEVAAGESGRAEGRAKVVD